MSGAAGTLASFLRRAPLQVGPECTVRAALERMRAARVGTVVVVDAAGARPLGILTQRDVLERVALGGGDFDAPVACVMTGGVVALPRGASAHEGRLALARHDLRHLVLVDAGGRFAGVLSRGDLYGGRLAQSEDLLEAIRRAADVAALAEAAQAVRVAAGRLVDEGVGAEPLGEWIAMLTDLIVLAAIDLAEAAHELPLVRWCWLAFGSEGRLEQTLASDQDNGLIFVPPMEGGNAAARAEETEALRARFLPFAQTVNRILDACGYPLCEGGIMAGNPQCCLSLAEWRGRFVEWMHAGSPEALLKATIFFDFRPLAGERALAASLRDWLLAATRENTLFLRFMAASALQSAPPLGLIRDFSVDRHTGQLDLKRDGSRPFVDAARIHALALGLEETSTPARLRAAGSLLGWTPQETAALVEAFDFILQLRLRRQRVAGQAANRIAPAALNELERAFLKESFRQARRLQQKLQIRYQL